MDKINPINSQVRYFEYRNMWIVKKSHYSLRSKYILLS